MYCVGGTGTQDLTIKELGGAGAIIGLDEEIDASYTTVIPGTFVEASTVGNTIDLYINSTKYVLFFFHCPFHHAQMGNVITFSCLLNWNSGMLERLFTRQQLQKSLLHSLLLFHLEVLKQSPQISSR